MREMARLAMSMPIICSLHPLQVEKLAIEKRINMRSSPLNTETIGGKILSGNLMKSNFMRHSEYRSPFGNKPIKRVGLWVKLIVVPVAVVLFPIFAMGQDVDPVLLRAAKRGDPAAMANLAAALDIQSEEEYGKDALLWAKKSAEKGSAKGCALLSYHFYKGIGTEMDWQEATNWAGRAVALGGDGLGYWVISHCITTSETRRSLIFEAFRRQYPIALLFYSRLYATGSEEFGVVRDGSKSEELLKKAAESGVPLAKAILDFGEITQRNLSENDYGFLRNASESGISLAMSLVASMNSHGLGVERNENEAFSLYERAASAGNLAGIEGLADCYRIGIGVGQNQSKAVELYSRVIGYSPRAKYLLACYKNEGVGTPKDEGEALRLFRESAAEGFVFSQAILGVALYAGAPPSPLKNTLEACRLLKGAIDNESFNTLPSDLKSKVYEYASACYRYGFGVDIDDQEADRLYKLYRESSAGFSLSRPPFGLVDALSLKDIPMRKPSAADLPEETIMNLFTLDYPEGDPGSFEETVAELSGNNSEVSFADESLRAYFKKHLGKDVEDSITSEDLASIKSLSDIKLDNSLASFDEFSYFTGVKVIPAMCFQGFNRLVSIKIPESVSEIKSNAFLGCSSLTSIEIPASVRKIEGWAFANCDKLRSFWCYATTPPEVGDNFLSHVQDVMIYVPKESVTLYKNAPGWEDLSRRIRAIN